MLFTLQEVQRRSFCLFSQRAGHEQLEGRTEESCNGAGILQLRSLYMQVFLEFDTIKEARMTKSKELYSIGSAGFMKLRA